VHPLRLLPERVPGLPAGGRPRLRQVYTGGIGTILTAWFDALKKAEDIQGLCIQCGNCKVVCPGKIDIPELILELRRRLAVDKGQGVGAESHLLRGQQPPAVPRHAAHRVRHPEALQPRTDSSGTCRSSCRT
jgi:L-lactate utilization protein LutB